MTSTSDNDFPRYECYRFGRFEAKVKTGFLLCDGQRVRIEELPFRMLLVLLDSAGQVVSKEELRNRLWGAATYGDWDNSLHVAVAKLRDALRDNAGEPKFVETVRRRGYRFIGEVEPVLEPPPVSSPSPTPPNVVDDVPVPAVHRFSPRWLLVGGSTACVLFVATLLLYRYEHRPLANSQDKVLIGNFVNSTGDDALDGLAHAFRVKVEESTYFGVIPDRRIRLIAQNASPEPTPDELRACVAGSGQLLLGARAVGENPGYRIVVSAWRCSNGRLLATEAEDSTSSDHVLFALAAATMKMRRRIGEPESSLRKFNVPISQATTASLAALKAFTSGEEKRVEGREFDSISDYKLAIDLDPQFALSYARLGTIYSNAAEYSLSSEYYKKAFDLRERTTDRERLYIAAHYYSFATGEVRRSIEAYELWRSLYPRDSVPAINLAVEYLSIGEPQKAVEQARAAAELSSSSGFAYAILARAYLETGNYAELERMCNSPAQGSADIITFDQACFLLAFVREDDGKMKDILQKAKGKPAEGELLAEAAWAAMYRGQVSEGRRLFAAAHHNAMNDSFAEMAATVDLDEAILAAEFGYSREAEQLAADAVRLAPKGAHVHSSAALVWARAADISQAEKEAGIAAGLSSTDTILSAVELPSIRAAILLQKHQPEPAIRALEESRPLDLCSTAALAPAYYRGLAYLEDKQPAKALAEFQKVIDHRVLDPNSPYIPLSMLNLGRAYQISGDRQNAQRSYDEAARIWNNADAHFPPRQELDHYVRELREVAEKR